jgi:hypothetical protein
VVAPIVDAAGPRDTAGSAADTAAPGGQACASYCACVSKQCAKYAMAPAWVKDATMCPARCAMFNQQQRACWPTFCDPNAASVSEHDCEHAWGGLGLSECP